MLSGVSRNESVIQNPVRLQPRDRRGFLLTVSRVEMGSQKNIAQVPREIFRQGRVCDTEWERSTFSKILAIPNGNVLPFQKFIDLYPPVPSP